MSWQPNLKSQICLHPSVSTGTILVWSTIIFLVNDSHHVLNGPCFHSCPSILNSQQCSWSDLSKIQTSSSGPENKNQTLYHSFQAFLHLASNYSLFSSFFSLSLTLCTPATLAFSLFFQLSKARSHLGVWVCWLLCRVSDFHSISNFFSFSSWRTSLLHLNAPSLITMLKSVPPFVLLLHIAYHYWQLSCFFKKKTYYLYSTIRR